MPHPSYKTLGVSEPELAAIRDMMSVHVDNWPEPKKFSTALKLIDKTLTAAIVRAVRAEAEVERLRHMLDNPPRHDFWGAGEPDCPRDIKAGNGELHTLRCKVCGLDSPRDDICRAEARS